jgi:hypothetical protein
MSKGGGSKSQKQVTTSEPWAAAQPYLKDYLAKVGSLSGSTDITPAQTDAFAQLETNAKAGNPFSGSLTTAANNALNYDNSDQVGLLKDAYGTLQSNLGDYASGKYLDVGNNPQIQAALKVAADDAQSRINQMFAGSGRSFSGANQGAVARGVTSATAPILLNEFNQQQQNQIDAAKTLFGGAGSTASGTSALDTTKANINAAGVPLSQSAMDAANYTPNQILNIEQQKTELPFQNLSLLSQLLLPAAGLGGTSNSKGSGSQTQYGITGSDVGTGLTALASLFALSDENAKDNIEPVGLLADGQPIYRYNYKDDPTGEVHIGLIAQDVEEANPKAVAPIGNGFKGVDYDAATRNAAAMVRDAVQKKGKAA